MARPTKEGLDYFPLDVALDDKFSIIEAEHGLVGFAICIKLLQKIYSEGYFYRWGEMEQILFSKAVSTDRNEVTSIVSDCLKWGLFSMEKFETYGILTSKGIQERYISAIYKRARVEMINEYLLIDVSSKTNITCFSVSDNENEDVSIVSDDKSAQSKVKESKVKESKVKESKERKDMSGKPDDTSSLYKPIVDYLNQKAGTSYKSTTKKTQSLIKARLAEGYGSKDFFEVIDKKVHEWMGTDMEKYLRPETLFGNKFEGYLNARITPRTKGEQIRQNIQSPDIQEWLHEEGGIF